MSKDLKVGRIEFNGDYPPRSDQPADWHNCGTFTLTNEQKEQIKNKGGTKYDQDKPPVDLVPAEAIFEIAKVLAFGAKKYDRNNWRKGIEYTRLLGAALRHIFDYLNGQDLDPESGLSAIAHAQCCLSFLQTFISQGRKELDDRYRVEDKKPDTSKQVSVSLSKGEK